MIPHIEIRTDGVFGTVTIDGQEINGVRRLEFVMDAETSGHTAPVLRMDLLATDLTIDTYVLPELPEPFKNWYIAKNKVYEDTR